MVLFIFEELKNVAMRSIFITVLFVLFILSLKAQNVGQTGDTIVNYIDINGLKQGHWKKIYENGNTAYEGYFKNDKAVGNFKRYFEKGGLSTDLHCDDLGRICRAKLFHPNNKVAATGNYYEQKKDSIWNYYTQAGDLISVETYQAGLKHGKFYKYYADGNLAEETTYDNDKLHGVWRRFYPNGNPRIETMYKNDKRHGLFYVYFENGKVQISGAYSNNLRNKSWIFYLDNGKIDFEMKYKNGKAKNPELLEERQRKEFEKFEKNRYHLKDPQNYMRNPEEYFLHGR